MLVGIAFSTVSLFAAPEGRPPGIEGGKVEVTLVLLDTVVTDRKGNPVAGLKPGDFDLLIDNVRSPIESLEEKCRPEPGSASATMPAGTAPAEPRSFILLFDMTHMKAPARRDGIKAAIRFVDEVMTDEDRTMVLAFKRGLHIINLFSADRAMLKGRLKDLVDDREMMDSLAFEEENRLELIGKQLDRNPMLTMGGRTSPRAAGEPNRAIQFECEQDARSAEIESTAAIRAFANTMPAFGAVRGRKAIFFFSETLRADPGLPFYTVCGLSTLLRPSLGLTLQPEIQDLESKANLAGVSFYPIHAAGMAAGPTDDVLRSSRDFETGIALATGGKNFVLMNDALAGFRQAARDLSCHYVLAYRPPEGFAPGRHTVKVTVHDRSLAVRHRQSFTLERPEEISESAMLAALSSPGIYRELKVDGRAYSLEADGGKRRVLVKASVRIDDLALTPMSETTERGAIQVRGGVISSKSELACAFSRTIPFVRSMEEKPVAELVGLEASCSLPEGENEIVVAARDETGGALGTFWGKIQVKPPELHTGPAALLWTPAWPDIWERQDGESGPAAAPDGFFVRESFTMKQGETAVLTLNACAGGEDRSVNDSSPEPAVVHLRGPAVADLQAREITPVRKGRCRTLRADIGIGALAAGIYEVDGELPPPWFISGSAVRIKVE